MKIKALKNALPAKVQRQIDERSAIKSRVSQFLKTLPLDTPGRETLLECLRLTELSYQLLAQEVPLSNLDRTKSLVGRHLYVSARYPQPVSKGGEPIYGRYPEVIGTTPSGVPLFPVLQLDLSWLNTMCDRNFEPDLLQLWLEPPHFVEGVLRCIPLADLREDELLPVRIDTEVYEGGISNLEAESRELLTSNELQRSAGLPGVSEQTALQIVDCRPIGLTGPNPGNDVIEELTEALGESISEETLEDLWQLAGFANSSAVAVATKLSKVLTVFGYYPTASGGEKLFGGDGCIFGIAMGSRASSVVTYVKDPKSGKITFAHHH